MEVMRLLADARQKGLEVCAKGTELVVRGPRSQEQLAKTLLERKIEILNALKAEAPASVPQVGERYPYLTGKGVLVIPFDSHKRFHWWNGGQEILATLEELGAGEPVFKRYIPGWNGNRKQNRFDRN